MGVVVVVVVGCVVFTLDSSVRNLCAFELSIEFEPSTWRMCETSPYKMQSAIPVGICVGLLVKTTGVSVGTGTI